MFLSLGVSSFAEAPEEDAQDEEPLETTAPVEEMESTDDAAELYFASVG